MTASDRRATRWLGALGAGAALGHVGIAWLGWQAAAPPVLGPRATLALTLTLLALGGLYLAALAIVERLAPPRLGVILMWAAVFRLCAIATPPLWEDDVYRYWWDGQTVLAGVNPYWLAPAALATPPPAAASAAAATARARLENLANASPARREILAAINNPTVPSLYPPLAQAVFAAAQWATPATASVATHLLVWRLLLLLFEAALLATLVAALRRAGLSVNWCLAWAWCPVVVKELANSGHVDVVAALLTLLAFERLLAGRAGWAAVAWGAAILTKLYPVALVLPVAAWLGGARRAAVWRFAASGAVVVAAGALVMVAGWPPRTGWWTGLLTYGARWEMNNALFLAPAALARWAGWPDLTARVMAGGVWLAIAGGVAWWLGARRGQPRALGAALFLTVIWLLLLSPTGYPWYFTGAIVFLPWARARAWRWLVALLPVYYARFWLRDEWGATGVAVFDHGVVWLEFGLPLLLLALETWRRRRRPPVD